MTSSRYLSLEMGVEIPSCYCILHHYSGLLAVAIEHYLSDLLPLQLIADTTSSEILCKNTYKVSQLIHLSSSYKHILYNQVEGVYVGGKVYAIWKADSLELNTKTLQNSLLFYKQIFLSQGVKINVLM